MPHKTNRCKRIACWHHSLFYLHALNMFVIATVLATTGHHAVTVTKPKSWHSRGGAEIQEKPEIDLPSSLTCFFCRLPYLRKVKLILLAAQAKNFGVMSDSPLSLTFRIQCIGRFGQLYFKYILKIWPLIITSIVLNLVQAITSPFLD